MDTRWNSTNTKEILLYPLFVVPFIAVRLLPWIMCAIANFDVWGEPCGQQDISQEKNELRNSVQSVQTYVDKFVRLALKFVRQLMNVVNVMEL